MEKVKKHFEEEAKEFDRIIQELVPFYNEMVDSLVSTIPFDNSASIGVVDLGCGTGSVSKKIKERFPNAKIICIDLAAKMIEMAQLKLVEYDNISYYALDFRDFEFGKNKHDLVVSSLALHHLTNEGKKQFYKRIYDALSSGGAFYNADIVLGSSDDLQEVYMEKWKDFMMQKVSKGEIEKKWLPKHEEEDIPAMLIDQLDWLQNIGFKGVDVVWKYYYFAVYGGIKF